MAKKAPSSYLGYSEMQYKDVKPVIIEIFWVLEKWDCQRIINSIVLMER